MTWTFHWTRATERAPGEKVLKDRRAPRRRGRTGTSSVKSDSRVSPDVRTRRSTATVVDVPSSAHAPPRMHRSSVSSVAGSRSRSRSRSSSPPPPLPPRLRAAAAAAAASDAAFTAPTTSPRPVYAKYTSSLGPSCAAVAAVTLSAASLTPFGSDARSPSTRTRTRRSVTAGCVARSSKRVSASENSASSSSRGRAKFSLENA
eukprot:30884-Pelagococcus_subviridis.AAC.14